MPLTILKKTLPYKYQQTHALLFIPNEKKKLKNSLALITHGYTSHKGSLLNWAMRMAEEGIPTALFDLPGHHLGNFSEVENFEDFKNLAHVLFFEAHKILLNELSKIYPRFVYNDILFAGHSLGALMALKSYETKDLYPQNKNFHYICVGLGISDSQKPHIFETDFYKSTMSARSQLVSPALKPENIFPWIREEKDNFKITGQRIYLLAGEDDLVISRNGVNNLAKILNENGNELIIEQVKHLPHHMPELAAPHIKKHLRRIGILPEKKVL